MLSTRHSELHEDFLLEPSKVDDILKFLGDVTKSNKMEGAKDTPKDKVEVDISASVTDSNFMVTQRAHYNVKRSKSTSKKITFRANMNQMTFMRQIDVTQEERKKAREERLSVATNYRRLGNAEYRIHLNFDKAIEYYTKGLSYINDSPVLYVNRALCYIKKRDFKRGLMDLDHVLNYLDGRCLRAWLYKAAALKRMNNESGFEECVGNARRFNRNGGEYIEYFLTKLKSDF